MGEWSYYRGHFNGSENGHVTEVASLKDGEWPCYGGGQFNGENGCYRGSQFNGERMIMLERWSV